MNKLVLLLGLFLSINGVSQNNNEKSKMLLDKVYNKIKKFKNIEIAFKVQIVNLMENIQEESTGVVLLEGEKFRLNYLGVDKIKNDKNTYTIIHENEEVVVEINDEEEEFYISPSKILTFYREGYTYNWRERKKLTNNRIIQYIELIPMKENEDIKFQLIGVDVEDSMIYSVEQIDYNDSKTIITISDYKASLDLDENIFNQDLKELEKKGYFIIHE